MRVPIFCAAAVAAVLAGAPMALAQTAASRSGPAPSVDSLIARHLEARGGAAQLAAIKSVTMTGKMRPGGFDGEFAFQETVARPGAVRMEITLQGLTIVQAWNGQTGWQIQPFGGRKDPEALSGDDAKSLQEEADFESPLVDYKAKGATVDYLGMEDVDGAPAHALRVRLKNGDEQTYYLDPDAMMVIRVVTKQVIRGAEQQSVTDYGDYEKIDGVYFPLEMESGPRDRPNQRQRVTLDKVVLNTPVEPSIFVMPAAAAAPAAAPAR